MSRAPTPTGNDPAQALRAAMPAIDEAARRQAEDVALVVRQETGVAARVVRRASGDYVVSIEGPGLFAREFGSMDAPADSAIANVIS